MQFTAQQIATLIQGIIIGDANATVDRVSKIEEAKTGSLSFVANAKYEEYIYTTAASILIVNDTLKLHSAVKPTLIRVKDAYGSFAVLLEQYNALMQSSKKGIEQPCYISPAATVGNNVYVGAFSYVGDKAAIGDNVKIYPGCFVGDQVVIKDNTTLFAGVKLYHQTVVGKNVTIHAGTVIGSDGFGFAPQPDGAYKKIPQIGNVVIEDNVEIGANTTIDRATMGSTIIKKGVKLDNLIQVAHNVEIGSNTVVAAQAGISGSTKIGEQCMIGGQAGIVGHIQIADGTQINAQSGVSKSTTEKNKAITGSPAFDYKMSLKSQAIFRNLPELQLRLQKLEEMVQELSSILNKQNQA